MTTRDVGISLHEELDRREKLIAQLQGECDAFRIVLGIIERPTPEAHNRVTNVIGKRGRGRAPKASPNGSLKCEKCGRSDFTHKTGLGKHRATCDGDPNRPLRRKPAENTGHNITNEKQDAPTYVPCLRCGEKFPDAKSLGIHSTRVHFGDADRRNSVAPI